MENEGNVRGSVDDVFPARKEPRQRHEDGTVNIWNKLERPRVYRENGHVTHFTFAAIDVDKDQDNGFDNHCSKIIVVPFDGVRFDAQTGID